jgi:hypothetical protein
LIKRRWLRVARDSLLAAFRTPIGLLFVATASLCYALALGGSYVLGNDRAWTLSGVLVTAVCFLAADLVRPRLLAFTAPAYTAFRTIGSITSGLSAAAALALLHPHPSVLIRSAASLAVTYLATVPILGIEAAKREHANIGAYGKPNKVDAALALETWFLAEATFRAILVLLATWIAIIAYAVLGRWIVVLAIAVGGYCLAVVAFSVGWQGSDADRRRRLREQVKMRAFRLRLRLATSRYLGQMRFVMAEWRHPVLAIRAAIANWRYAPSWKAERRAKADRDR